MARVGPALVLLLLCALCAAQSSQVKMVATPTVINGMEPVTVTWSGVPDYKLRPSANPDCLFFPLERGRFSASFRSHLRS